MPAKQTSGAKRANRQRVYRATSYDVARRAGVSQATVSRCFMPDSRVSPIVRRRIEEVANELGYRPNAIARSLITRRSNLVAIVISNLTNLYYPEVLSELSQGFSERGVRVLLFTLPRETEIDLVLEQVWQYRVDGLVAAARLSPEQASEFERHCVPLVFFNRRLRAPNVSSVVCNQLQGVRALVGGLFAAGHRRFAVISGPRDSLVGQERLRGILLCLRKQGAASPVVVDGDFGYDGGVRAMHEIMKLSRKPPDAIICTSDITAVGCIDAARYDFSIKVSEELSVASFDGVDPAHWRAYRLTTFRQPMHEMADAAVSILMDRIEDPSLPPVTRVFSGTIESGQSARIALTPIAATHTAPTHSAST